MSPALCAREWLYQDSDGFSELLPASTAVAAIRGDVHVDLFAEEEVLVRRAVDKRRREFITGRACARAALEQLGLPAQAIPSDRDGAPRWPSGTVGSITHCEGYRACAVARKTELATIGIDAEPNGPLSPAVRRLIALPQEERWLDELTRVIPQVSWGRLLFSMKEAVFKAWWPLTGRGLAFQDVVISVDPRLGTFEARFRATGPTLGGLALPGFAGRWLAREGLVLAAVSHAALAAQG